MPEGRVPGTQRKFSVPDERTAGTVLPGAPGGSTLRYVRPALPGNADGRVRTTTRLGELCRPGLDLVAPAHHPGATISGKPDLYWYVSNTGDPDCAGGAWWFVLRESAPEVTDPVLELALPAPTRFGRQLVRLQDHPYELQQGVRYEWSIELRLPGRSRADNPFSTAPIVRTPPPEVIDADFRKMGPREQVPVLGKSGLWYDMIAALERAISAKPGDPELESWRVELFAEQGIGPRPPAAKGAAGATR